LSDRYFEAAALARAIVVVLKPRFAIMGTISGKGGVFDTIHTVFFTMAKVAASGSAIRVSEGWVSMWAIAGFADQICSWLGRGCPSWKLIVKDDI
jgi:hypothetical protein